MAAKTTSAPVTRILQSSYGPIGSGIPSRNQAQPIQRPNPSMDLLSLEQSNISRDMCMPAPTTPLQSQGTAMNGMMGSGPNMVLQPNVMTSGQNLGSHTQNAPIPPSATPGHQGAMQSQGYRASMATVQGTNSMAADGVPRSNVGVTPVRNFPEGGAEAEGMRWEFILFSHYQFNKMFMCWF